MKVVILNEYQDKELNRKVKAGEVLDMDEDRIEVLESVGINVELYDEDLDDETAKNELIASYKNDKNIVDGLKSDDLKVLCEEFGVSYSNVGEAKEALKIITIS